MSPKPRRIPDQSPRIPDMNVCGVITHALYQTVQEDVDRLRPPVKLTTISSVIRDRALGRAMYMDMNESVDRAIHVAMYQALSDEVYGD